MSCKKKDDVNSMPINSGAIIVNPVVTQDLKETVVAKTLQEQIENYSESYVLLFQEEGNFTNSEKKEILAFYQTKSSLIIEGVKNNSVRIVYCFICDESNQTILNTIEIKDYGTAEIEDHLEKTPLEALGRKVWWLGKVFGYIGDFNNNGKEELYFFELSSTGVFPAFYEFDGSDFKELLSKEDFFSVNLDTWKATNIDTENKVLTFEHKNGEKPARKLAWNEKKQMYERME